MHKPNLLFLTTLSMIVAAIGCPTQEEESQVEEGQPIPDTTALAPDTLERIGAGWVVRTPDRKACVFVPRTAVPEGQELNVRIQRTSPFDQLPGVLPPAFGNAEGGGREVFPPIVEYSVTDTNNQAAQFADSVVFAMCFHHQPGEGEAARLARDDGTGFLDELPDAPVPAACQLRCSTYPSTESALLPDGVLEGGPWSPTPLHAAMEQTGLGGKGLGTSPFAAVGPPQSP